MTTAPLHHPGLDVLDEDECFRLLRGAHLGRVALSVGALPAVFPVHFELLGRDPVFRTDPGTKLSVASAGSVLCLEVDCVDAQSHSGWSVMVTGLAEVLTDEADLAGARALPLRPWVGRGDAFVRIAAAVVSGRSVGRPYPGQRRSKLAVPIATSVRAS